ncbi:MAG: ASCH domain-containing protein [Patescibacteria group bacterium]|nr:ASCH domain-containing protein [Patescibacteria group bacterium]
MKALSIKQPWAHLIVNGIKDIENRDWPTKQRGIVAVHSSAKLERAEMKSACDLLMQICIPFSARRFQDEKFPTGSILGTVEIVDCVAESDSLWFFGKYGFVLQNPVAFDVPIPCRGALGFWNVPENILPQMREQYKTGRRP